VTDFNSAKHCKASYAVWKGPNRQKQCYSEHNGQKRQLRIRVFICNGYILKKNYWKPGKMS